MWWTLIVPILLGLKARNGAPVRLDLENDEAEIWGKKISLDYTTSGHNCIPVDRVHESSVFEVYPR